MHAAVEIWQTHEHVVVRVQITEGVDNLPAQTLSNGAVAKDIAEEGGRAFADRIPAGDDEERGIRRSFSFGDLIFARLRILL